jgi:hypothetical protein
VPLPAMHVQCPNHLRTDSVPGRALYIYICWYPRNLGPKIEPVEFVAQSKCTRTCHKEPFCLEITGPVTS